LASSGISGNPERQRAAAALSLASSSTPISCDFHGVVTVNTCLTGASGNSASVGGVASSRIATRPAVNFRRWKSVSSLTS
jgi:hypothetical protein